MFSFSVVAPVSFQAETITLAGTMGKDMKERISMVILGGVGMTYIGIFGLLERIVTFIGPAITSGMMTGVGIMLTRVAVDMAEKIRLLDMDLLLLVLLPIYRLQKI